MKYVARAVFNRITEDLEHDADRWTVRLCSPTGDLIWRNVKQREHYVPLGYVPSPVLPWTRLKVHFTRAELRKIERITRAAFKTGDPITDRIAFELNRQPVVEECKYLAAFGHRRHGVLVICCRSYTSSGGDAPPACQSRL